MTITDPAAPARLTSRVTASEDRPTMPVHSPLTGAAIGAVPRCTGDDVITAVRAARDAHREWRRVPVPERARILLRFHDAVLDHRADLLDLVQTETGKSRYAAFEEVADVAYVTRYYAHTAARLLRPKRRHGALPLLTRTVEYRLPKGVVGLVTPWNYPLTLPVSDAVPALLAGNATVVKPASDTPLSVLRAAELLDEAGLPPGLFQVVTGSGAELGPPLIDSVDFVMFTGSTATGRVIAERCARNLIGFSAELGGKNAAIVLADADLGKAVEGVTRSCFASAGQLCISIERVYVERPVADRFVELFADRVRRMRLSGELRWGPEMGSITSAAQLDTVTRQLRDAVGKGATVVAGGQARPDLGPLFFEPTVLTDVPGDATLAREETFGPVVAVYPVDDADEAVERANDSRYGLNADVWTGDPKRGEAVARRLEFGTVNVNEDYTASWGSADAPMGGMKESGVGRRHGREGLLKYTEPQTVAVQRLLPIAPPRGVSQAAYARALVAWSRLLRRLPILP
ncbi:MAG TPA: succinic semialdehyde dehydrogenase [Micromonosporaceae bacterium]